MKFIWTLALLLLAVNCQAATLFSDSFNYSDSPNNHGWGAGSTSSIAVGAGPDGSNALAILFNCDSNTCGNRWHNWNAPANTSEVWIKFSSKLDCGAGTCVGGAKYLKIFGKRDATNTYYANQTFQMVYSSALFSSATFGCVGDVRDTGSAINYTSSNSWDFENGCSVPTISDRRGGSVDMRDGNWHTWKYHIKRNDDGVANGVTEIWYDGAPVVKATGMSIRSATDPKDIDYIQLGGWNQSYGGVPYTIYYDNFTVSSADMDATATHPLGSFAICGSIQ